MYNKIKLLVFTVVFLIFSAVSFAKTEIDGIYYYLNADNTALVTSSNNKYSGSIIIPSSVISSGVKYTVTGIMYKAFYHCTDLTSVTIPNTVTRIGYEAFYGCN